MSEKPNRLAELCKKEVLTDAEEAELFALARELGYEGPLTVDLIRRWVQNELRKRHEEDDDDDYRPPRPRM